MQVRMDRATGQLILRNSFPTTCLSNHEKRRSLISAKIAKIASKRNVSTLFAQKASLNPPKVENSGSTFPINPKSASFPTNSEPTFPIRETCAKPAYLEGIATAMEWVILTSEPKPSQKKEKAADLRCFLLLGCCISRLFYFPPALFRKVNEANALFNRATFASVLTAASIRSVTVYVTCLRLNRYTVSVYGMCSFE